MIERAIIRDRLHRDKLRMVFAPKDSDPKFPQETIDRVNAFRKRMASRIQAGREGNLANYRTYRAVDLAWDVPFKQTTQTLVNNVLKSGDKARTPEEAEKMLQSWGFDIKEIIQTVSVPDPKNPLRTEKRINIPAFYDIFVPLCKAYVTMRWAKITGDRNQTPFLQYEPAFNNARSRMQCEVITARIEQMARQYGHFFGLRQAVFQMLHYSKCAEFPIEEWHSEEQETTDKKYAAKDDEGQIRKHNGNMFRIMREGLRFHYPHPTRFFIDEAHRPSTFNTDTGCSYGGYWRVQRYGDVRRTEGFWNVDNITIGTDSWWTGARAFFENVYPTVMKYDWPSPSTEDREQKMIDGIYTTNLEDKAIVTTEYFEKLIPSQWGIGKYDYPLWFRFVVGGYDTILYAAPMPYSPITWYGYDADENRAENASMTLEVLPFQDHFSNLLTQYILTIKQNLTNATFVDTDVVGKNWMDQIRNWGERLFRVVNFIEFSGRNAQKSQHGIPQAFHTHRFQQQDAQGIAASMRMLLDILERVLAMSSMEVGQAASHEQTTVEVNKIDESKAIRVQFSATPVDQALDAKREQLYNALMYYGSDEYMSQVPYEPLMTPDRLKELGFTWDRDEHPMSPGDRRITVTSNKAAIAYVSFATKHDDNSRRKSVEAGTAMLQALTGLLGGPLGATIGPDQGLMIVNLAARMMDFPREFKLENRGEHNGDPKQAQAAIQDELQKMAKEIMTDVQKGMIPMMDAIKRDESAIVKLAQQMQQILSAAPQPPSPGQYDNTSPVLPTDATGTGAPVNGVAQPAGVSVA